MLPLWCHKLQMDGWVKSHFVLTLQIPDIDFKMYPPLAEDILKVFYLCGCYWASFSLLPYIFLFFHAINKTLTSFFLNKIIARFWGEGLGGLMLRDGQSVTWNHPHSISVALGCEQLSLPPRYKGLRKSTAEMSSLALDTLMKLHFSAAPWKHNGHLKKNKNKKNPPCRHVIGSSPQHDRGVSKIR